MASIASKAAKSVYRGYMPPDLPQHRPRNRFKPWWKVTGRPHYDVYPKKEIEGYSEQPEYPPLNDGSQKGLNTQVRLDWYDSLKSIPTVDNKMHEIMKHCSHYVANINNWLPTHNSLPLAQYLTQTHLISSLPERYDIDKETIDQSLVDEVRTILLDQIALDKFESKKLGPKYVSKTVRDGNQFGYVSNRLIQNIYTSIKKLLVLNTNPELLDYHVEQSPAVRSWWFHSGLEPPNNKVFYKARKDENGNINQMIQIDGATALNLLGSNFIEPIVSLQDPKITDTSLVENHRYPLRHFGGVYKYKRPVNLAGHWFDCNPDFNFPHTTFISTDCLNVRNMKSHLVATKGDEEECLTSQAIMTSFSWLNSLSMYHGYTPFQELDYPFTCQTITTDGQNWLFNVYQLNCHSFHRDLGGPKRNNLCWTSGLMQLFNRYENGEFSDTNDDVIKHIVRFMSQKTNPEYTSQLNLKPHLSIDERTDEEREKMRTELRRYIENRKSQYILHRMSVPLYEHIFFRSKVNRYRITHMKPVWHPPNPKYPKIFE